MPESRPSDPARGAQATKPRDFSIACTAAGILSVAAGAWLFHPGAGLILGGLALAAIGVFGAPRKA